MTIDNTNTQINTIADYLNLDIETCMEMVKIPVRKLLEAAASDVRSNTYGVKRTVRTAVDENPLNMTTHFTTSYVMTFINKQSNDLCERPFISVALTFDFGHLTMILDVTKLDLISNPEALDETKVARQIVGYIYDALCCPMDSRIQYNEDAINRILEYLTNPQH